MPGSIDGFQDVFVTRPRSPTILYSLNSCILNAGVACVCIQMARIFQRMMHDLETLVYNVETLTHLKETAFFNVVETNGPTIQAHLRYEPVVQVRKAPLAVLRRTLFVKNSSRYNTRIDFPFLFLSTSILFRAIRMKNTSMPVHNSFHFKNPSSSAIRDVKSGEKRREQNDERV